MSTSTNQQSDNFFGSLSPFRLTAKFGSPLYVYREDQLRKSCRSMLSLLKQPLVTVNYSIKANNNPVLLRIIREEGLHCDAMSPGEIYLALRAGFKPEEIFYISNNATDAEFIYAAEHGIITSVDSLDQLELYGKLLPGCKVALRINTGIGAGHHAKVVTGGKNSKFGLQLSELEQAQKVAERCNLAVTGLNQHIGSLFLSSTDYLAAVERLLALAEDFTDLEFLDFGGGFGIPYRPDLGETELDLTDLSHRLNELLTDWRNRHQRNLRLMIEPGRYITARAGVLVGKITSVKAGTDHHWVGTDLGFNNFQRSVLYDSYHRINVIRSSKKQSSGIEVSCVFTGNICESGDLLSQVISCALPAAGDLTVLADTGAYGFAMSSSYNGRLRPAEILISNKGSVRLIREREKPEDLLRGCRL